MKKRKKLSFLRKTENEFSEIRKVLEKMKKHLLLDLFQGQVFLYAISVMDSAFYFEKGKFTF